MVVDTLTTLATSGGIPLIGGGLLGFGAGYLFVQQLMEHADMILETYTTCPPGMYEDWTDGILHCHSAHGTRQLDPNVKELNPYWQNAWGIDYVDNNAWGDYAGQPNMNQPLVQPNKEIESQIKKGNEHEVMHQKTTRHLKPKKKEGEVTTQIECRKNFHDLPIHASCWKNGKLYEIVGSEAERESLYPPAGPHTSKRKPSITGLPIHYPIFQ